MNIEIIGYTVRWFKDGAVPGFKKTAGCLMREKQLPPCPPPPGITHLLVLKKNRQTVDLDFL